MVMVAEKQLGSLNSSPLQFLQLPRMTVTESSVKNKIKIKIDFKGVRLESDEGSREYGTDVIKHDKCRPKISIIGKRETNTNISVKLSSKDHAKKRGPDAELDDQKEKRRKIDRSVKQQCACILKELMTHKCGWAFNHPVDPVAYNIPDYFSIVKQPMDLGSVKSKMENNVYLCADEFAADVRLTFSNCMLYNPPHNDFHRMAKELNNIFNRRWKLLETKLKRENYNLEQVYTSNGNVEVSRGKPQTCRKVSPSHNSSVNKRSMSLEEKQKLRKELKEILSGKMSEKLQSILKKFNLSSLKEKIDMDVNNMDDEILWELKRTVKSSLNATDAEVEPEKMKQSGGCAFPRKVVYRGTDSLSRISCCAANAKTSASSVDTKCGSCGSLACRCSLQSSKVHASITELSSEKALQEGHRGLLRADYDMTILAKSCMNRSDPEASGAESSVEEGVRLSPTNVCDEALSPGVDVQLSPKKALRAAMLKSRFADTIFKAKQRTLLDHGDKTDPVKLQQDKERLQKQQREEKARIEAQIVAAEAASRLRVQEELKMQREREREAARIALQQMEKTVELDDNLKFLKDLEMLSQASISIYPIGGGLEMEMGGAGRQSRNLLERLGLYIKEDFVEDDDDETILHEEGEEGEEGEIMS